MGQMQRTPVTPQAVLGVWRSAYRYPSSGRHGIFENSHFVQLHRANRYLIAESLPGSKSYLLVRLTIDGQTATGSWHEQTEVDGYYKGATYHGAIQLVLSKDGKRMRGKWVGFGKDMEVNVGAWELSYVGKEPPANFLEV